LGVRSRRTGTVFGAAVCAAALLALAPAALAKTYHPNKTGDHLPNGCTESDCTLREAVISANARLGSDKIVLVAGKTYKLSLANAPGPNENAAATGDLDILNGHLQIKSDSKKLAKINGGGIDSVFDLVSGSASFKRIGIRGGNSPNAGGGVASPNAYALSLVQSRVSGNTAVLGGGIFTNGPLAITKSTVSGNPTTGSVGGILAVGPSLRISASTISGNTAVGCCGGIYTVASTSIDRSTISGNTAEGGGCCGGIYSGGQQLTMTNSTVADNAAAGCCGGLFSQANSVLLSSSTVARNHGNTDNAGGDPGGGIVSVSSSFVLRNSIIALNTVGAGGTDPDCYGPFISQGVNLFSPTLAANCTGFLFPPNLLTSDPKLGSLKNNGGLTKTLALKKHSPAINNAGSGSPKRDQRGEKRKKPDIGAFEFVKQ
jgi:hypothetical protein